MNLGSLRLSDCGRHMRGLTAAVAAGLLVVSASPASAGTPSTERVSVGLASADTDGDSMSASVSADGTRAAFYSSATNLVRGDTNGFEDVFVRDVTTGQTSRISIAWNGKQANGTSSSPVISANGKYVAFSSQATNLVRNDTNGKWDVLVANLSTGRISRISKSSSGTQGNDHSYVGGISGNGMRIAFLSGARNLVKGDTNRRRDVFVRYRGLGVTRRVSLSSTGAQANGVSFEARISADGSTVAFVSQATNLVTGDTNKVLDVFVRDLAAHKTERVTVSSDGSQSDFDKPGTSSFYQLDISGDGTRVVFASYATNLVPNDTNWARDVFLRDRAAGNTVRVSVPYDGVEEAEDSESPVISQDGRFVASDGTEAQQPDWPPTNLGLNFYPDISANGETVLFCSYANNLAEGDANHWSDVYLHRFEAATP
ncbi:MAG TPA: hypothetical protein VE975_08395 [Actinomycetota bacterium]|nr:hypothetical protein [Actinomycetota bacterium]